MNDTPRIGFEFAQPSGSESHDMAELAALFEAAGKALVDGRRQFSADAVGVALVRAGLKALSARYDTPSLSAWLERTIIELQRVDR